MLTCNEIQADRLKVDMTTLIEIMESRDFDYRRIETIVKGSIVEVYLRRYGSQTKVAEVLGINRGTLRKWVSEYAPTRKELRNEG